MLATSTVRSALLGSARCSTRPTLAPRIVPRAAFLTTPRWTSTKRYTKEHEWIEYDDSNKLGTIGITDYAQKSLGDVVFVELPAVETELKEGDQMGSVESVKAASDIFAPVSGIVKEVNEKLQEQSNLLNRSPEADGWLAKIELSNASEMDSLLTAEQYDAHCEGEDQ